MSRSQGWRQATGLAMVSCIVRAPEAGTDGSRVTPVRSRAILAAWTATRSSAIRYYPPTGDVYFDVLTRLGDAERFETVEAEIREIEGARVWVVTPAALYRLKKGTVRPIDHQDAAALRERFNLKDEA